MQVGDAVSDGVLLFRSQYRPSEFVVVERVMTGRLISITANGIRPTFKARYAGQVR